MVEGFTGGLFPFQAQKEKQTKKTQHCSKALEQPGESIAVDWVANPFHCPQQKLRVFSKDRMGFAYKLWLIINFSKSSLKALFTRTLMIKSVNLNLGLSARCLFIGEAAKEQSLEAHDKDLLCTFPQKFKRTTGNVYTVVYTVFTHRFY